jgi:alkylated DNA repair dioxygenase AlkB
MRTQWKKALFYCAALPDEASVLLEDVGHVVQAAPFRHLVTPGGYSMSVAMTNCGRVGWVSDRAADSYDPVDSRYPILRPLLDLVFGFHCENGNPNNRRVL